MTNERANLLLLAAFLILVALLMSGCSAASPVAPSQADSASTVYVSVHVLQAESHTPIAAATVSLDSDGAVASVIAYTDADGNARVPAHVGDAIIISASADGYRAWQAAAVLSSDHESWTFYLEKQVQH